MSGQAPDHGAADPDAVLAFWRAAGHARWFTHDPAFDAAVRDRFLSVYEDAAAGRLAHWEATGAHALALVIVLDQFPRNMFRGEARAFAADPLARAVADRALARGLDASAPPAERSFFYLPFMHSEALADQERSVALCQQLGDPETLRFAQEHAAIIRRFGRFPHRNAALGRAPTPEELAFLAAGGFAG